MRGEDEAIDRPIKVRGSGHVVASNDAMAEPEFVHESFQLSVEFAVSNMEKRHGTLRRDPSERAIERHGIFLRR